MRSTKVWYRRLAVILIIPSMYAQAVTNYPFPRHTVYAPNTIKPNYRSQTQLDNDVRNFYNAWKTDYLVQEGVNSAGQPLYRINTPNESGAPRTVSEGQGYGMLIVALMAGYDAQAQTFFDGLWRFSRLHPSINDNRLMDWEWLKTQDVPDYSAFDGDADIAYALLLADKQWSSSGAINYKASAITVLAGVLQSTTGPASYLPTLGNWVKANDVKYNQFTPRPSDFMISHFRTFRTITGNTAWDRVTLSSQAIINAIQSTYSPTTGLLPDFIVAPHPAPPNFLEGPNDGAYSYNSGRVPWRIGLDVLLNNNAVSRAQVKKISTWISTKTGGYPAAIKAGYMLNGTPVPNSDYFSPFFVTPFGVAAMCDPLQQTWLNAIYNSVYIYNKHGYYEDTITLLGMLAMTGNYWNPAKP